MASTSMILSLLALSFGLMLSDARILEVQEVPVLQAAYVLHDHEMRIYGEDLENKRVCTLCEQFASQSIEYLSHNKTQQEIEDTLRVACSRLQSLEKQCTLLVDYYVPLLFTEVATIDPQVFCEKVNLCGRVSILSMQGHDQACTICQNTITQLLSKLRDPETQLDAIQFLLKACGQLDNYAQQCKRLVFEYGPVILVNLEKYLETTDICAALHVCRANEVQTLEQASLIGLKSRVV